MTVPAADVLAATLTIETHCCSSLDPLVLRCAMPASHCGATLPDQLEHCKLRGQSATGLACASRALQPGMKDIKTGVVAYADLSLRVPLSVAKGFCHSPLATHPERQMAGQSTTGLQQHQYS